jgi:hypothetical protein
VSKVLGEINMEDLIVKLFQLIVLTDSMQIIAQIYVYHFVLKIKIILVIQVQDYVWIDVHI